MVGLFDVFTWLEAFQIGEESGHQSYQGQERAHFHHEDNAGGIGEFAEDGGGDARHAKREAEEKSGDGADFAGEQFRGIHQDRREGGGMPRKMIWCTCYELFRETDTECLANGEWKNLIFRRKILQLQLYGD